MNAVLAKAFITVIFVMTSVFLGISVSEYTNADDNPKYEFQGVLYQRDMVKLDCKRLIEDIKREQGYEENGESIAGQIATSTKFLEDKRTQLIAATASDDDAAERHKETIITALGTLQDIAIDVSNFTASIKAYREAMSSFARKSANLQDVYQDVVRQYESLAIEKMRMQIEADRLREDGRALDDAYIASQGTTNNLTETIRAIVSRNPWVVEIARNTGGYIEGKVEEVSNDTGVIAIDKGSRDNPPVRIGMQFSITRGAEFVGKLEIILVKEQYSVGRLVFPYEGAAIRSGDNVRRSPVLTREGGR